MRESWSCYHYTCIGTACLNKYSQCLIQIQNYRANLQEWVWNFSPGRRNIPDLQLWYTNTFITTMSRCAFLRAAQYIKCRGDKSCIWILRPLLVLTTVAAWSDKFITLTMSQQCNAQLDYYIAIGAKACSDFLPQYCSRCLIYIVELHWPRSKSEGIIARFMTFCSNNFPRKDTNIQKWNNICDKINIMGMLYSPPLHSKHIVNYLDEEIWWVMH